MRQLKAYLHKIQYYETDAMGIVHHSNYLRFMEEGRNDFTDQSGTMYALVEEEGFFCLVTKAECRYHAPAHYGETLKIITTLESYNGVKLVYTYELCDAKTGKLKVSGRTEHCFIDKNGNIARLQKSSPKNYQSLCEMVGVRADA